ncbi:MAG: hypothetical protein CL920_11020 [Deltaproteobacteria bacterium]|nr:hypothetical protein [Deltaproteobacteria bacterium]
MPFTSYVVCLRRIAVIPVLRARVAKSLGVWVSDDMFLTHNSMQRDRVTTCHGTSFFLQNNTKTKVYVLFLYAFLVFLFGAVRSRKTIGRWTVWR